MVQATLSPNWLAYASMTNQSPENNLTPRIEVTLTRTGILDCRGKLLLQKLEQFTLNDIEIDNLRKFFTVLDYFHLYKVQTPGILPNLKGCNLSWEREDISICMTNSFQLN